MKTIKQNLSACFFLISATAFTPAYADFISIIISDWQTATTNFGTVDVTVWGVTNGSFQQFSNPDLSIFSWVLAIPGDTFNIEVNAHAETTPGGSSSASVILGTTYQFTRDSVVGIGMTNQLPGRDLVSGSITTQQSSSGIDAYTNVTTGISVFDSRIPSGYFLLENQDSGTDTIFGDFINEQDTGTFGGPIEVSTGFGYRLDDAADCTGSPCDIEVTAHSDSTAPITGHLTGFGDANVFDTQTNGVDVALQSTADFTYSMTFALAAPVPVPAAVWLFGSGLLGLVGIARRKKA